MKVNNRIFGLFRLSALVLLATLFVVFHDSKVIYRLTLSGGREDIDNSFGKSSPLSISGMSLLALKSSRINVGMHTVSDCNAELFRTVQIEEVKATFFLKVFNCALEKLKKIKKSCEGKCKLLKKLLCKCNNIEKKEKSILEGLEKYKQEQKKWNNLFFNCVECRVLISHLLKTERKHGQSGDSSSSSSLSNTSTQGDDEDLLHRLLKSELATTKIAFLESSMNLYKSYVKDLCKINKVVCSCAHKVLKSEIAQKKELKELIKTLSVYISSWYSKNARTQLGHKFSKIKQECSESKMANLSNIVQAARTSETTL